MNLNSIFWADSLVVDLKYDDQNNSLSLNIKDFRNDLFIIIFEEISHLYINDPVYFIEVNNKKKGQKYEIDFWDDEEKVLSFEYTNVMITNY